MKKYIVFSLFGVAALMSSCVVDPYAPVGGAPGYYGPYGEPYFVYGSVNYYSYGGRYYYVDHGRRVYVQHLPSGGHYYHGHVDHHVGPNGPHYTTYNNKQNYTMNNKMNQNVTVNKGQQFSTGHVNNQFTGQKGTPMIKGQGSAPTKTYKDKDKHN